MDEGDETRPLERQTPFSRTLTQGGTKWLDFSFEQLR
jgi:hypothetical protein